MREFEVTLKWGRRESTSISHGARTADQAALAHLRMARENWRGPKPLRLSLTVAPHKRIPLAQRRIILRGKGTIGRSLGRT